MTPSQFRKWLHQHYDRKQPRPFLADFNAVAQAIGAPQITWAAVNHWMYERTPPAKCGPLTFEEILQMILERRANPGSASRMYTVLLTVDAQQEKAIEKRAWNSGCSPEEWLRMMLEAAINGGNLRG